MRFPRYAIAAAMLTLTSASAAQADVSVAIVDAPRPQPKWGYAPATKQVDVGTWVTWSNDGQDSHTVTADDASFDSGNLDPSEGFSWYFDTPGTFTYMCAWHAWMKGEIVVN
jgi:plastocyanin